MNTRITTIVLAFLSSAWLAACGGGGGGGGGGGTSPPPPPTVTVDGQLRQVIAAKGLTGDPTTGRTLPSINDPLAQLGKLFVVDAGGDIDAVNLGAERGSKR